MKTYCVFDIETVALPLDSFDEAQQEYLFRHAHEPEQQEQAAKMMALSPLTAKIACIGLAIYQVTDTLQDAVMISSGALINEHLDDEKRRNEKTEQGTFVFTSERKVLEMFWHTLDKYPNIHLISFNGRNFDAPFLMLRSAVLRVPPSRNLMKGTKFNYPLHTDLCDELSFYSMSKDGATKRYNFDFYARAFGIASPKAEGIHGGNVAEFYAEGKLDDIAHYCMRDVFATWQLFTIWHEYLGNDNLR